MVRQPGDGHARILDLALWLGRARLREHQLEALAERELNPVQRAQVEPLLHQLRTEIRARLERIHAA